MIWDLLLAGVLAWLVRRGRIRSPGVFALYVAGYSAFRLFEENLRIDYSVHVLGMRLNFWIALIGTLAGLTWFVAIQRGWGLRSRRPPGGRPAGDERSVRGAETPSSRGRKPVATQRRA
jgi:prolipoprotein diacylglyceryltransferase